MRLVQKKFLLHTPISGTRYTFSQKNDWHGKKWKHVFPLVGSMNLNLHLLVHLQYESTQKSIRTWYRYKNQYMPVNTSISDAQLCESISCLGGMLNISYHATCALYFKQP